MSTDTASGAEPRSLSIRAGGWSIQQRGSFVVGRCDACDFTTSARRARYSVENDMVAHGPVCSGPGDEDAIGSDDAGAGSAPSAAPAPPDVRRSDERAPVERRRRRT